GLRVGVILNRVGSEAHRPPVTEAIEGGAGLPVLGTLYREDDLRLPERYLGLVPVDEGGVGAAYFRRAAAAVAAGVDLNRLLQFAEAGAALGTEGTAPPVAPVPPVA